MAIFMRAKLRRVWSLFFILCFCSSVSLAAGVEPISPARCQAMKQGLVINEQAPVNCERLRVISFSYLDFQGQHHSDGEIVVLDAVASQVADLFDSLLKLKFPIHQAKAMEHFKGNDDASMAANNTSAFVYRVITGDSRYISLHAYGVALDINPVQNPYLSFGDKGSASFKPEAGQDYANRETFRWGKPVRRGLAEQVVDEFARHGFVYWGGYWNTPIDYQHFQTSREMAEFMVAVSPELATTFFQQYVNYYRACEGAYPEAYQRREFSDYTAMIKSQLKRDGKSLLEIYRNNRSGLERVLSKPVEAFSACVIK